VSPGRRTTFLQVSVDLILQAARNIEVVIKLECLFEQSQCFIAVVLLKAFFSTPVQVHSMLAASFQHRTIIHVAVVTTI